MISEKRLPDSLLAVSDVRDEFYGKVNETLIKKHFHMIF